MKTIGIIAGNGRFPVLSALRAKDQGYRVVICGLEKEADPGLVALADPYLEVKIGQIGKLRDFFAKQKVREVIMAGKIRKVRLFQENVRPDFDMVRVLMKVKDFKDDSLLGGIADYLEAQGIRLMDSTLFLKESMPGPGVLTRRKPSRQVMEDIRFGFEIAKKIAGLDIGQTVVVKKKSVLAVEAIEGTDLAIRRGGELGKSQAVVVKVSKPGQDMRFDVPAVGVETVAELAKAGAAALAFEAGKTLFLDREEAVLEADRARVILVGVGEKS